VPTPTPASAVISGAEALVALVRSFDPALVAAGECASVAEALARAEKACSGARVLAAARAVSAGEHRRRGFSDPAAWLSRHAGTTVGSAREQLRAGEALGALPVTQAALVGGEVSLAQAAEVVRAEAELPGCEARLLDLARRAGLGELKDQARKVTLAASDPAQLFARQHAARYLRHWVDRSGMVCLSGALPPAQGLPLVNRLDALAQGLRKARGKGADSFEACSADALVELSAGGAKKSSRSDLNIVVDLRAYRRGHAQPGEPCHLVGGGPVPVAWLREALADPFVKAVVHDGVKVLRVAHLGRHMKAELRTALELGKPPGFEGTSCAGPGCGAHYGLQWDHRDPVANLGPTSYDNLQPLCRPDHWEKTRRDREAGLLGRSRGRPGKSKTPGPSQGKARAKGGSEREPPPP